MMRSIDMNRKSGIRVGDSVRFRFGIEDVIGIIEEDCGPIGRKGRNLYRIQFSGGLYVPEPFHVELGADQFTVVSPEDVAAGGDD
jgi:hypothetical protein